MTRQEAVERLKSIKSLVDKYDDVVALREAIKALEQESCEDAISRQYLQNQFQEKCETDCLLCDYDSPYGCGLIDNAPSVIPKQEPCEEANANQHNSNALNDVGQHKNALEEDAISRQAAIDALNQSINILEATDRIVELPTVTPKQRVGRWEIISGNNSRCSICGVYNPPDYFNRPVIYNYCPFCGAKMEGQP